MTVLPHPLELQKEVDTAAEKLEDYKSTASICAAAAACCLLLAAACAAAAALVQVRWITHLALRL
jgi:hypothetical protein